MGTIGILSRVFAHDFNDLLNLIKGNADLALMDIDKENPLYTYLKEISTSIQSATFIRFNIFIFMAL